MPFAAALRQSLQDRGSEIAREFMRGDTLEDVLNRHLMTVERLGGNDVFTCILLLNPDGKTLSYGASPRVPATYCRAAEKIELGLRAGSCAAAAHLGRPVYSIDIETDPIWANSRDLALQHGFRSCWSTPIRNSDGSMLGTFAILHKNVGEPTREEVEAIDLITEHVAEAIMWFRDRPDLARPLPPVLTLVADNKEHDDDTARLAALIEKLQSKAADLDRHARDAPTEEAAQNLRRAAELSRRLAANLRSQIELGKRLP